MNIGATFDPKILGPSDIKLLRPGVTAASRKPPEYFRTYEQLKAGMAELQAKYPDLVEVRDIGDSYEKTTGSADRDVLALVLTNKNRPSSEKARVVHTGGVHAREIANPELLMTFGSNLLKGFGRDADATMLLNTREIILVPMVNPDGHSFVERAYAGEPRGDFMKRKNASGENGEGVDINRNFEFHWGGAGASTRPRSETYRGPSAGSEPETQAIQGLLSEAKTGVYVDWHSHSGLNLYPWGDTRDKTPDHDSFKALAEKFTSYNGYRPVQSVNLYPTTGTTDDHAYGMHKIPALAVETGHSFHQSDQEFAKNLEENLPVLQYTAKIANDAFRQVHGPDTLGLEVAADGASLVAQVNDSDNGGDTIAGAELVRDPQALPGTGVALNTVDGALDSPVELVTFDLASHGLAPATADAIAGAKQLVYVRGQDAAGNWGPLSAAWVAAAK